MTTNKPKIAVHRYKERPDDLRSAWLYTRRAGHVPQGHHGEALIRLSDYEALQAECEKLRKDAERYRWLRLGAHDDSDLDRWEHVGYVCGVSVCTDYGFQQTLDAEALDAAIDAAMQRDNPC